MSERITLLENQNETSADHRWPGGAGAFFVSGSFGTKELRLEVLGPDNLIYLPIPGIEQPLSDTGVKLFTLPQSRIRALLVETVPGDGDGDPTDQDGSTPVPLPAILTVVAMQIVQPR